MAGMTDWSVSLIACEAESAKSTPIAVREAVWSWSFGPVVMEKRLV